MWASFIYTIANICSRSCSLNQQFVEFPTRHMKQKSYPTWISCYSNSMPGTTEHFLDWSQTFVDVKWQPELGIGWFIRPYYMAIFPPYKKTATFCKRKCFFLLRLISWCKPLYFLNKQEIRHYLCNDIRKLLIKRIGQLSSI